MFLPFELLNCVLQLPNPIVTNSAETTTLWMLVLKIQNVHQH